MPTPDEMHFTRTCIAFSICTKYPNIFKKIYDEKGYVMGEKEKLASETLRKLIELDPSIKGKLEYYEGFKAIEIVPLTKQTKLK